MQPKINHVLYLQVASLDEEEAKIEYKSRIADVTEQHIAIEIPINTKTGRYKKLFNGDQIHAYFVTEDGVKNFFNSEIIGSQEDIIRLVLIRRPDPSSITKVQRRNFLRVPANLEVAVRLADGSRHVVLTEDVGGGGISFFTSTSMSIHEKMLIECWVLIPFKNGTVEHAFFKGEVVRIKPLETSNKIAMISYAEIADIERQKIIRFCFERQLDFRKR